MRSPIHHVSNGKPGGVLTAIDLRAAIAGYGVMFTISVAIIAWLGGARWNEHSLSLRFEDHEKKLTELHQNGTQLAAAVAELLRRYNDHENWSAVRSAQLAEIEAQLRLMRQRESFYHPESGKFGGDVLPPGMKDDD